MTNIIIKVGALILFLNAVVPIDVFGYNGDEMAYNRFAKDYTKENKHLENKGLENKGL